MKIKKVTLSQIDILKTITTETFVETFGSENSESDLKSYIEINFSIKKLKEEILTPFSEYYFASVAGKIVGYIKLNHSNAQTKLKEYKSTEVQRLFIKKEFQGKGAGNSLLNFAIHFTQKKNLDFIWLGVWEKNIKAIKFYRKHGFFMFSNYVFQLGKDKQNDILMKLELKN